MQTDDLQELLDHSRRNNAANGITGALIYSEGMFLQIIEGDKVQLQDLMTKIRRDVRHESVFVLRESEVPKAMFSGWKMAYVSATPKQVAKWIGVSTLNESAESPSEAAEEQNRTTQFAQDILSLLVADDTTFEK
jgi:Sensors of blue-light using FAD